MGGALIPLAWSDPKRTGRQWLDAGGEACGQAHNWLTRGEVITTLHREGGREWLTIDHADPQIEVAEELLRTLAYPQQAPADPVAGYARVKLARLPWADADGGPLELEFAVVTEADGTRRPVVPDFRGALLRIEGENWRVVYQVRGYLGRMRWLAVWPD